MRNLKLSLSYDGTAYHGWQRQENALTVQEVVENALASVTGERISVIGCSRTDAGVHARRYVCNFYTACRIPAQKLPFALNAALPRDIAAFDCCDVPGDFHARYSAKSKKYNYKILNSAFRDPFLSNRAWHYPIRLDLGAMREAAAHFLGRHDFTAFMAAGGQQKQTEKEIYSLSVEKSGDVFDIDIHANGYLYNMVRIIAGTLAYAGCGKLMPNDIPLIIASRDRTRAGITAPPQGLTLMDVLY